MRLMQTALKYSIIVPVYNRPDEMDELLTSLVEQTYSNFEVIVVEDGSTLKSESVAKKYSERLNIQYFYKNNTGPGPSRNFGFEKAKGEYFVIFDSDCILPPTYFESIEKSLSTTKLDAWGGPDRGHENFTLLQRAMAHTMSSFLTTGGIRGSKKIIGNYQPRSFNMGISKETYEKTGGFRFERYAEDIELSVRIKKLALNVILIPDAYVFHKRRSTLAQFFGQVSNFGKGRVLVGEYHVGEVKWVHWFPTLFMVGLFLSPFVFLINKWFGVAILICYSSYLILIAAESLLKNRSVMVALLSIPAALAQLTGYGSGFLAEKLKSLHGANRPNEK
jgi:glycosyltransferase involved in cell wall biosynthesis